MGPYLTMPRKEKDSVDGENDKVLPFFNANLYILMSVYSCDMELVGCRDGETLWKTHILLKWTWVMAYLSSESMMDMEVCSFFKLYLL